MTVHRIVLLAAGLLAFSPPGEPARPVELGDVDWRRGFAAARAEAVERDLPMLVLFDEVPGCHTVVTYGREVLTHPLVVEAAETLFVPVAVYNNVGGARPRPPPVLRSAR